jgi:hypothetical protein
LQVCKSQVIPDLRQTDEDILNCVKLPILRVFLGHSKETKVTWTQVRRISWMGSACEVFRLEFFLDFAIVMTFE